MDNVILSVARVDNPAKNLESYLREEILRKKVQEVSLRMTELFLVCKFFVSPLGWNDTSPLRYEAIRPLKIANQGRAE